MLNDLKLVIVISFNWGTQLQEYPCSSLIKYIVSVSNMFKRFLKNELKISLEFVQITFHLSKIFQTESILKSGQYLSMNTRRFKHTCTNVYIQY